MMLRFAIGALLAVYVSAASLNSRNIERSGKSGDVSLVEFAIRDVVHGKCSFVDKIGRDVKLIYEESDGKIQARCNNPTVIDPVVAVKECRAVAVEIPKVATDLKGRNQLASYHDGSPFELRARFNQFARTNFENRQYVEQLQPRFLTWAGKFLNSFGNLGNNFGFANNPNNLNNIGLSFGNDNTDLNQNPLPGINLIGSSPQVNNLQTTSFGNPTDIFNEELTGPWGVLNSIKGGGFTGFGNNFNWWNPLGFLNPFNFLGNQI